MTDKTTEVEYVVPPEFSDIVLTDDDRKYLPTMSPPDRLRFLRDMRDVQRGVPSAPSNAKMIPWEAKPAVAEFVKSMMALATEGSGEIQVDIMDRILAGETIEDVSGQQTVSHGKEMVNRPFILRDFGVRRSNVSGGLPFYLALDIVWPDTGEPDIMSLSAIVAMTQIAMFKRLGALPVGVVLRESTRATPDGYYPISAEVVQIRRTVTPEPTGGAESK